MSYIKENELKLTHADLLLFFTFKFVLLTELNDGLTKRLKQITQNDIAFII